MGVYASPLFWKLALGTTLFQAMNMSVQGLWAGPWLVDVAGLERQAVAFHLLALGIAAMCGFLFWGAVASRLARRGVAPMSVLIGASAIYLCIQLFLVFGAGDLALPIWNEGAHGAPGDKLALAAGRIPAGVDRYRILAGDPTREAHECAHIGVNCKHGMSRAIKETAAGLEQ